MTYYDKLNSINTINHLDVVKLTKLLTGDYIAECHVPDRSIMNLRKLAACGRTKLKNRIHSIVLCERYSDI